MTPRIGPNVAWQLVDGEAIVIDLASGSTIGLNPTGTFLWSNIDGVREVSALAAAVAEHFSVDSARAAEDATDFFSEMQRRTLVVDAAEER